MIQQIAVVRVFGCDLRSSKTRYCVMSDAEYEEVLNILAPYRSHSVDELDKKLVAAKICVFGMKRVDDLATDLVDATN